MMNDLSDQEKSVLLAKARGEYAYETVSSRGDISHFMVYGGRIIPIADYYKPANMALAKRAIRWGYANNAGFAEWLSEKTTALEVLIQEDGMRRALDYLVEPLAIEVDKDES